MRRIREIKKIHIADIEEKSVDEITREIVEGEYIIKDIEERKFL